MAIDQQSLAGEYRGLQDNASIIIRVDFGKPDSLSIISGDLYLKNGENFEFQHSFVTTALIEENGNNNTQSLSGPVNVFANAALNIARLDLVFTESADPQLTYTFYKLAQSGRQTAVKITFPLNKTSEFFRYVELEMDRVTNVPLPLPFDTASHSSTPIDYPPRSLTFDGAYRDVGIEMNVNLNQTEIPISEAGEDGLWTDEELHAAMVNNFSKYQEQPQWRLYLLLATKYVNPGVLGIMFDSSDEFPRQGSAVFAHHPLIANAPEIERNREYLFTIVHELGHAFNFLHSFQKGLFDNYGVLPRPDALSWMNYPQFYPYGYSFPDGWDGSESFWNNFRFQFDPFEVMHLRHHDSMEVMMGGRNFGAGGHLEDKPFEIASNENDLSLTLWLPPVLEFMENIEADIRIRNESNSAIEVNECLDSAADNLELRIRRPGDRFAKKYRDFKQLCVTEKKSLLQPGEALYQELSLAYGLKYWFIDEPGTYEIQAVCYVPDGRKIYSEVQRTRVLSPDKESDRIAQDFFNDDIGTYLGLEGSRIEKFNNTTEWMLQLQELLPTHKISRQTSIIEALKNTRVFKQVSTGSTHLAGRDSAAKQLLQKLNVNFDSKQITTTASQSNLKTIRYLKSAASCLAKTGDVSRASEIINISELFLKSIKAPTSAISAFKQFSKNLLA